MKCDGKSSEDKKPAWNRAKVSIETAAMALRLDHVLSTHAPKSMQIYENLYKSCNSKKPEIKENLSKSLKIYENI